MLSALKECLKTSTNFGRQTFLCHCAACSSTWTFVGLFVLIFIKKSAIHTQLRALICREFDPPTRAAVSLIPRQRGLRIPTLNHTKDFFILFTKYKKQSRVLVIKIDKTGNLGCMLGSSTPHFRPNWAWTHVEGPFGSNWMWLFWIFRRGIKRYVESCKVRFILFCVLFERWTRIIGGHWHWHCQCLYQWTGGLLMPMTITFLSHRVGQNLLSYKST